MNDTARKGRPESDFPRNFNLGDLVKLSCEPDVIYRVESYCEKREVDEEETFIYVEYTLIGAEDETRWDIGYDEDMTLVARKSDAERYLRNLRAKKRRVTGGKTIDALLDEYNDYMRLFWQFGDKAYKQRAKRVMSRVMRIKAVK